MSGNDDLVTQDIIKRIERLEKVVFSSNKELEVALPVPTNKYNGAKGGILLLLENNFFKIPRTALEVKNELEKNDYHYAIQVIQTALNRLASSKGPLTAMKDAKNKVYAKRK